jgi:2-dehydro-3-deoxyphosphooctonate aldolase (KDO 8-P synthase)
VTVRVAGRIPVGAGHPPVFFAGPCVIESESLCLSVARRLKRVSERLGVPVVFKASFDKANRTSFKSFRGPGLRKGLAVLQTVTRRTGLPTVTDIHEAAHAAPAARAADVLQIPAFLCRQTDLIVAAARTGKPLLVKKGQFLAPADVENIVEKVESVRGNGGVMIGERGVSFGYHNLVVDFKGLPRMRLLGIPVVFDATHSVQHPGGAGTATSGEREMIAPLARAAAAVGVDGFFIEVHPDPSKALSDGANALPLSRFEPLVERLLAVDAAAKKG